jgi:uncharacterized coiled-coil protein SlyX
MSHSVDDRLLRLEEKLAHMERLLEQLNQATLDQELRIERVQTGLEQVKHSVASTGGSDS